MLSSRRPAIPTATKYELPAEPGILHDRKGDATKRADELERERDAAWRKGRRDAGLKVAKNDEPPEHHRFGLEPVPVKVRTLFDVVNTLTGEREVGGLERKDRAEREAGELAGRMRDAGGRGQAAGEAAAIVAGHEFEVQPREVRVEGEG